MKSRLIKDPKRVEDFVGLVSDWLWETDKEKRLVFSNGRLEAYLYAESTCFSGQNFSEVIQKLPVAGKEDVSRLKQLSEILTAGQRVADFKVYFLDKSGQEIQMTLQIHPVLDEYGVVIGCRGGGSFQISQRKSAEGVAQLETLLLAVENSPNGILITDADGVIRYTNPGFTEITGYDRQESYGKTPRILSSGHNSQSFYGDFWKTIKEGNSWRGTVCNKRKSGELFWCQETVSPVIGANGEITNFIAIQQDVSEEVEAKAELKTSQDRFQGFAEAASDWYWEMDADLIFTYASESVREYVGQDLSEMLGKKRSDLVTFVEDQEAFKAHIKELEARQPFKDFAYSFARQDGKKRRWQISGKPFYSGDRFLGYRGVGKDVTESTELEEQLRQSQKMEVVGHLTGGVAHDFNNLLGIIMGNTEILLEQLDAGAPIAREKLDSILYAADRGAKITSQLLFFSRKHSMHPKAIHLDAQMNEMMDILKTSMGKSISVEMDVKEDLWPCYVDPDQFVNAVLNLSINARDAMNNEGVLKISLQNEHVERKFLTQEIAEGDYTVLTVSDTGTGISKEIISRVIEPFYTTKEPGKGTGLGLSMVYGFANKTGGAIWIESEEGTGTDVHLYLPRYTEQDAA